jgi:hypothetical protein
LRTPNLNGGTFCNTEFVIRHGAAPYRKGQVLHSVFAAALYKPQEVCNSLTNGSNRSLRSLGLLAAAP